jgi:hypothetical protein
MSARTGRERERHLAQGEAGNDARAQQANADELHLIAATMRELADRVDAAGTRDDAMSARHLREEEERNEAVVEERERLGARGHELDAREQELDARAKWLEDERRLLERARSELEAARVDERNGWAMFQALKEDRDRPGKPGPKAAEFDLDACVAVERRLRTDPNAGRGAIAVAAGVPYGAGKRYETIRAGLASRGELVELDSSPQVSQAARRGRKLRREPKLAALGYID